MKLIFILLFICFSNFSFGQQCKCDSNPDLKEFISCKRIHFTNNAKLYWQYNCDSSWLVFERLGNKEIIYSSEPEFTERIGYIYATEYKSTFLIKDKVISGCCDPPDFILFNKTNGKPKLNLGRVIYYSEDSKYPFVIHLTNSNYNSFKLKNYNSLTLLNVDKNKSYKIELPKGRIYNTLKITDELFPEHLFSEGTIKNGILEIPYRYRNSKKNEKWLMNKIIIDLKKYKF